MRRRLLYILILLLAAAPGLRAQWAVNTAVRRYVQEDLRKGGTLPFYDIGSYVQYVPGTVHLGLGLAGVPASHALLDRSIESAIAHLFCFSAGHALKYALHVKRPDSDATNSCPSGHASVAFTGAELLRMDYGWGWGAGGYTLGVFVCADRIYGDRHWLTDVIAGAGLGILSAHVGGWLLEPVKRLFGIPELDWDGFGTGKVRVAATPAVDPVSGSSCISLALQF